MGAGLVSSNPWSNIYSPGQYTSNAISTGGGNIFNDPGMSPNSTPGGGGFNWGSLGNILNGGFDLYNLISGINANNQIGGGLAGVGNQYQNLLGQIGQQYQNVGAPLTNQLAGAGSNMLGMLNPWLSGNMNQLLNNAMNPQSPTSAVASYNQAIQPWVNSIADNLWGQGTQAAQNAAQQFGMQGQPMQGAGGPANAFDNVISGIPSAITAAENATLPGVESVFNQALQAQYGAPINTTSIVNSLFGPSESAAGMLNALPGLTFQGLSGFANMLQQQQQQNAQSQQNAGAAQQNSGGGGGFLGGILNAIPSILGIFGL